MKISPEIIDNSLANVCNHFSSLTPFRMRKKEGWQVKWDYLVTVSLEPSDCSHICIRTSVNAKLRSYKKKKTHATMINIITLIHYTSVNISHPLLITLSVPICLSTFFLYMNVLNYLSTFKSQLPKYGELLLLSLYF